MGLAQSSAAPIHPRGLILPDQLASLRAEVKVGLKAEWLESLKASVEKRWEEIYPDTAADVYEQAYLGSDLAASYLLTEDDTYAERAYTLAASLSNSHFLTDPFSRGLTRALVLQQLAIMYDFCYASWSESQRQLVNEAIQQAMFSVNANMGYVANYNIASNWMGVRYGSVILAANVWDDPWLYEQNMDSNGQEEKGKRNLNTDRRNRSRKYPLLWDATKRLQDHLAANLYENGWNGESLGYHVYNWSFIGPALIALRNQHPEANALRLASLAPKALYSIHAQSIANVAIPRHTGVGMKPDLSDDNLNGGPLALLAHAFELYPAEQHGAIRWMFDYLSPGNMALNYRGTLLYSLLYYPEDIEVLNPAELGWNTYHDSEQGIVMLRNAFEDEEDVLVAFSATSTRVKGHKGPDTNALRLMGSGVPWIIGGGRTSETAGQSTLFPAPSETPAKGTVDTGVLHSFQFSPDAQTVSGHISGSCVGVEGHHRHFVASIDTSLGAQLLLLIADSSYNGRRFRINTPEFITFSEMEEGEVGYRLTAPNGASLQVKVLHASGSPLITERLVRYGGKTVRLNPGIGYHGKGYVHSRAIDIACEGHITVAITLQPAHQSHPPLQWNEETLSLNIGTHTFTLTP